MSEFNPSDYGPVFAELVGEERDNPLDGGTPNTAVKAKLEALTVGAAFEGKTVADDSMAQACISGAWLYHNFLDDSHTISQGILTDTGSFWHGIMHRREPDFSNSKYWFRKVGEHAAFPEINDAAKAVAASGDTPSEAAFLKNQAQWDAFAFVDLCEGALHGKNGAEAICRAVQLREWQILFDFSYRKAVGA